MVPVGMVAECVAIKSGLTEIVQTFEILRRELIVSELAVRELIVRELIVAKLIMAKLIMAKLIMAKLSVGGEIVTGINCVIVTEIMGSNLMTAAAQGVTSKSMSVIGVRRGMTTPPMTNVGHATVGSKPAAMPATAPTVNSSKPSAAPAGTHRPRRVSHLHFHRRLWQMQKRLSRRKARPPQHWSPECLLFSSS
jgi:hypothetical protein